MILLNVYYFHKFFEYYSIDYQNIQLELSYINSLEILLFILRLLKASSIWIQMKMHVRFFKMHPKLDTGFRVLIVTWKTDTTRCNRRNPILGFILLSAYLKSCWSMKILFCSFGRILPPKITSNSLHFKNQKLPIMCNLCEETLKEFDPFKYK